MNNRKHACLVGPLLLVATAVGCSQALVGTWKTDPIPEDESFYIIQAQFKDDGTYDATASKDGETVRLAGTYDFNGSKLTLKTPQKPERVYGAIYVIGGKLELTSGDKKLVMKKQ